MSSPTVRSLTHLRGLGYIAEVVEKTIPRCFIKRDLFKFADIVAVHPARRGVLFVQVTSGSNVSARIGKLKQTAAVGICMAAGNGVLVHGWSKKGKAGKRKLWTLREVDLQDEIPTPDAQGS